MTPEQLAEMQAVAEAATPGPWKLEIHGRSIWDHRGEGADYALIAETETRDGFLEAEANATHIATFDPPTVLALIAELRAARDAILAVVSATRAYLPPDGIDAQECINRILVATDNPTINPLIRGLENGRA